MPGPVRFNKKGKVVAGRDKGGGRVIRTRGRGRPTTVTPIRSGGSSGGSSSGSRRSSGGRTRAERNLRRNLRINRRQAKKAKVNPLATKPAREAIDRLREKYSVSMAANRREQALENTAVRSAGINDKTRKFTERGDKARTGGAARAERKIQEIRKGSDLNPDGITAKTFRGLEVVGTIPVKDVRRAAERGQLRKAKGKQVTTPEVRRVTRKAKRVQKKIARLKRKVGTGGMPEGVPPEYAKWIRKFSPRIDKQARATYGLSGNEFMAKMLQGESGFDMSKVGPSTPYGNARGAAQFIPPTRDAFVEKFGIDPWRSVKEAVQAMALHLDGKSYSKTFGIQGYNPGINDSYYLNQDVGRTRRGNPRARQKLRDAREQGRDIGRRAAELGIDTRGLISPKEARQFGVKPPEQSNVPRKTMRAFKGMIAAAKQLEAWGLPYVWGGGHGTSKVGDPRQYGGLDCSSTVSHILQQGGVKMPTVVSGDFGRFTKPGPGAVTILYNPTHVLMKIGNKYFGTSGTNPGGGPGWLDKSLGDSEMASGKYNIGHIPGLGPKIAKQMSLNPDSYRDFPGMTVSGNTATVNNGTVSYTPTLSSQPIVEGNRQGGRKNQRQDVLDRLREVGFNVTASGIKRTGVAGGPAPSTRSSSSKQGEALTALKRKYKVR